ncbi:MAG TPA: thioredoxin [Euryarchaeota archaeon]|nr:thioredoxin-1 [archaeon BMS3Bbin15]HDL14776.1 thioredoxin [Euryarchaeota archaeon]
MKKLAIVILLGLLVLAAGCTGSKKAGGSEAELSQALNSGMPTLVMFYATWCPPCKMEKPVINELQRTYSGKLNVVYIDVDKYSALTSKYGVRGTPTMMFFNGNAQLVQIYVGYTDKQELLNTIGKLVR